MVSQSCAAGTPGAHPGMRQPGLCGRVAPGSAPPPARPQGIFLPLPGPAAFPRATHVCRAPRAVLPAGMEAGSREEFPWQGSSPKVGAG